MHRARYIPHGDTRIEHTLLNQLGRRHAAALVLLKRLRTPGAMFLAAAEVARIGEARSRVLRGEHAQCARCGSEIGIARLMAAPVDQLCTACAIAASTRRGRTRAVELPANAVPQVSFSSPRGPAAEA